jgi:hypothetical protein
MESATLTEHLIKAAFDIISTQGLFALLFILMIGGIAFAAWKYGGKITDSVVDTMVKISSTNAKFAECSENTANLIEVLVSQISGTVDELTYLRKHAQKLEQVLIEVAKIASLLSPSDNPEIKIRLENIEKEIRREN